MPVAPADAATVVLLRGGAEGQRPGEPEVLLTRRPDTMAFAPGRYVFPGGSVHQDDHDQGFVGRSGLSPSEAAERLGGVLEPERALALHVAALRELFEETGLLLGPAGASVDSAGRDDVLAGRRSFAALLADAGIDIDASALVPIARWVTPRFMIRRFDTWFFAVAVEGVPELAFDPREVESGEWIRPSRALSEMAEGRMPMWPPTSTTLQRLARLDGTSRLARLAVGHAVPPRVERVTADLVRIVFGAVGGVPGSRGAGCLVGRRRLVLVDPGDPGEEARDAILAAARGHSPADSRADGRADSRIEAIVLTSAEPERAAGCESLRGELDIPVFGPPGAERLLPSAVGVLADGERVPFGDTELRANVVAGPGSQVSLRLSGSGFSLPE